MIVNIEIPDLMLQTLVLSALSKGVTIEQLIIYELSKSLVIIPKEGLTTDELSFISALYQV